MVLMWLMGAVRAAKAEGLQIVPTPEDSCNELNSAPVTPFTAEFWPDSTPLLDGCIVA